MVRDVSTQRFIALFSRLRASVQADVSEIIDDLSFSQYFVLWGEILQLLSYITLIFVRSTEETAHPVK